MLYGVEISPGAPMDSTSAVSSAAAAAASNNITKAVDAAMEAPASRIQPPSTTNGFLKRLHPYNSQHPRRNSPAAVSYKDCLKNHAASLGGYAVDGCGEFMPSPSATPADPTSLKCAACGCHRNFHRREPEELPSVAATAAVPLLEFQPHHRHHPPPPPNRGRSPDSQSPPPISSSYYPSAPHMLLALSGGLPGNSSPAINATPTSAALPSPSPSPNPNGRKRFRTKFSAGQKEKMYHFAERVGWKMQKKDEDLVAQFCRDVGVERGVLKVWMHNNKNTIGRRDFNPNADHVIPGAAAADRHNHDGDENHDGDPCHHDRLNVDRGTATFGTNGGSSSSC